MKILLAVSKRHLLSGAKSSSRWISVLAVCGIAIGVMVLFVTMAVMTGFQTELQNRILAIESHIVVMRYGGDIDHYKKAIDIIRKIKGVKNVAPVIYAQGMLKGPKFTSTVVLRGIRANSEAENPAFMENIRKGFSGFLPSKSDNKIPTIVLGKVLAEKIGVEKKSYVILLTSPKGGHTAILPVMHRLRVGNFFETGMHEYDGAMAYVKLEDIQALLNMNNAVSALEVRVDNIYRSAQVARRIMDVLGYQYWVQDWQQMNRNLFSMLRLQKILMYIIMTLIILVAAFNISSALVLMVNEKRKDIAVLKTIGATGKLIRRIFLAKGLFIGIWGTSLGAVAGYIVCVILKRYKFIHLPGDVYFLTTLPVKISWVDVFSVIGATLVICLVATIYPASRASRQAPAEALRYG